MKWFSIFKKTRDPVKILSKKAMEKIFSYISGNDLLKLSLVNKAWHKCIGNSPTCMNKIRIHITEYFLSQKRIFKVSDVLQMLNGGRKYKHLSIACLESYNTQTQQFSPEHKLLMALYRWKSISLCNHRFVDEIEFVNFLGFIEPFVEEIELRTVKIETYLGACKTNFEFPKLKSLHLVNVGNFVYEEPFKNVFKLEEFGVATEPFLPSYLDHSDEIKERTQSIAKILFNNRHIKHLELFLDQKDFDRMFMTRKFVTQIEFSLRTLMVGRFRKMAREGLNYFQLRNFHKFLRLHEKTLTEIWFPECLGKEVLEIVVNQMNNLKHLTIHDADCFDHTESIGDNLLLFANYSVETLNIRTKSTKFSGVVSSIVKKLPRLKTLTTGTVNQLIFDVLAETSSVLESINVDFFTANSPPLEAKLTNLKNMSITIRSNDDFREKIEGKDQLSHFDEIFLTAAKRLNRRWDVNNKSFYRY